MKAVEGKEKGWKIREATSDDLPRISGFRETFIDPKAGSLRRSCEASYFEWKCFRNPFQRGEMWLAEDGTAVVGMKSVTPKKIKFSDQVVLGAEMGDSFTHPQYQRQGIFTALSKTVRAKAIEKGICLIYHTPGGNSLPAYRKYLEHAEVPYLTVRNLVRPINIKKALRARMNTVLLAIPFAAIFKIILRIRKPRRADSGEIGINTSQVNYFPDSIDDFWVHVEKDYEIILVRNREYLEWRYVKNPDNYTILLAADRDNNILGYIVTKTGSWRDLQVGYIVDFLTLNSSVFGELVFIACEEFLRSTVDIVSCWAVKGSSYDKVLSRAGFLPFKNVPVLCHENTYGKRILEKKHIWHFTMGDSDNI